MSLSWNVVGIRPPDEKFKRMKKAWDACIEAGIDPPAEVTKFFDGCDPDDSGVIVTIRNHISVTRYNDEYSEGYQVDLDKLPPDIKLLRFYVSS